MTEFLKMIKAIEDKCGKEAAAKLKPISLARVGYGSDRLSFDEGASARNSNFDDDYYYDDYAYDMLEEAADNLYRAREEFAIAKRLRGDFKKPSYKARSSRMLRH